MASPVFCPTMCCKMLFVTLLNSSDNNKKTTRIGVPLKLTLIKLSHRQTIKLKKLVNQLDLGLEMTYK
ncbi:hypothetical protein BLOT_004310 [Blomia tropicalis]|nr:hypothetical protein BLOT_004310 [Blomia tropicalis]